MEYIIENIKSMDLGQLIGMAIIMWFFYSRLETKIEKVEMKIEKLDLKINDIDKRVFAIETMLHMKDCCMLKDEKQIKKVD